MLYRAKDEVARHRATLDCLQNFRQRVTAEAWLSDADLDAIDQDVATQIDTAVTTARSAAPPSPAELETDVYVSY